jgi:RNA polymerase sigma factor (sigma-70 family)
VDNTSDHDLLRLMHRGDHAAARELWSRLGGRLTALAASMLRHSAGASLGPDVVQGVFLKVLRLPTRELKSIIDVAAWLTTLVRHEAIDTRRRLDRGPSRVPAVQAYEIVDTREATADAELLSALDSIEEHQRELILLKHVAGLTFDQLALVLEENRDTLASRYRVALQRLREVMSERESAARAGVGRSS